MEYTLHATTVVPVGPREIFDLITDIERLPDWNLEIPEVVIAPSALDVGSEWVVRIHAMNTHCNSRSRAVEIDRDAGRFAYRSQATTTTRPTPTGGGGSGRRLRARGHK